MKKLFAAFLLASLLCLTSSETVTAGGCYGRDEFEAEQGLRIHSELMVIGLTCQKMPRGQDMYSKYQRFTHKNQTLIAGYETDLIDFFRRQGDKAPEKELHALRTNLANEISVHAIRMSMVSFCQNFGGRIDKALSMDQVSLRRWAQHEWAGQPTSRPVCARF